MTDGPIENLAVRYRPRVAADLARLRAEQTATEADRAPVELNPQSVGRVSRVDAMQKQALAEAAAHSRAARIARLEQALKRMDESEFGFCADCGEPIPRARLDIDPGYDKCVRCAGRG